MAASTFSREIIDEEFWDDYERFVARLLLIPTPTLTRWTEASTDERSRLISHVKHVRFLKNAPIELKF
jgi:hypothetical protein